MRKIKAVLFDFDGTIADTEKIILDSWQEVFRRAEGIERPAEEIYKTYGEPLFITMQRFFGEKADEYIKIYRDYQSTIFLDEVRMYPGVEELIKRLKSKGYMAAIVTSRLKKSTYEILDKYGLADIFDVIITCEDTEKNKPDPEPALLALERLKIDPQNAVLIGDSSYDMGCGLNAGVKTVLVGWSVSFDEALGYNPDYIIEKAEDLEGVLEALC
ncbi:MAG: HAD-IIIA family hydrolase [Eubacteriales bacterium]|nr:HAD-IIIA family hydrolase [Eubacteriales bacterium]MDD4390281.1 HAD-IIIA family hydrolase [Eubacteriales bacterium]